MAINFPNSPTTGSTFTASGATWQWDGTKWVPYSSGQNFVSKTGDSMSGDLTILSPDGNNLILNAAAGMWPGIEMNIPASGEGAWIGSYIGGNERWEIDLGNGIAEGSGNVGSNFQIARYANNGNFIDDPLLINRSTGLVSFSQHAPVNDSSYNAADTYWVMNQLSGRTNRNRVINGNFLIDIWNGGNTITPGSGQFICDRWRTGALSQAGKFSAQNLATSNPGAPLYRGIVFTSLSAYTPVAADTLAIVQPIEYTNCADFQWGTSVAQPVMLSFWALAGSVTGTYSGSIRNNAGTRSYPFTFNITAINTWQYFTIPIPGDTAGTWAVAGNIGCIYLTFDLGSGSSNRGPANAWANSSALGVTGAVSLVATNASTLRLANIQLEMGSQATPFDFRSYADEILLCQRYYQSIQASTRGYASVANVWFECTLNYSWMRAAPTVSILAVGSPGNLTASYPVANSVTPNGCRWGIQSAAAGDCYALAYTLGLNAEL